MAGGDADGALLAHARLTAGLARTPKAPDLLVRWGAVAGAEALLLAGRPAEAIDLIGRAVERPLVWPPPWSGPRWPRSGSAPGSSMPPNC